MTVYAILSAKLARTFYALYASLPLRTNVLFMIFREQTSVFPKNHQLVLAIDLGDIIV